jgi:diacylglycerol kinase (ATP)
LKTTKSPRPLRAKLIFNSSSGKTDESANQLLEVVTELQKHNIVPEVYHFDDIEIIRTAVKRAKKDGTELILASGGDGTVDAVAGEIAGTELTLGIIPTGTANNLALNLKIPRSIPEAVSVLRNGTRVQADLGTVQTGGKKRYFLELVTFGILADIFPSTDQLRRGDFSRAGEFVTTFASSNPSLVTLELDKKETVSIAAYSVVVANMPYIGKNFRLDRKVSFRDSKLDVFVFTELTKLSIVTYAMRYLAGEENNDTVKHYSVREMKLSAQPDMGAAADGQIMPAGNAVIKVKPKALNVMAATLKSTGPRKREVADLINPKANE